MASLASLPPVARAIRIFAGWRGFPWKGKSFNPQTEDTGEGINRVVADRFRLFRFETFISKSKAGDFDALQLDYDLPTNPPSSAASRTSSASSSPACGSVRPT